MTKNHFWLRPRVLGFRKDGRPIYSIAGASPDDPSNNPPADPPAPSDPPADPPTDPGKTFTQADVDRIINGRFAKYADYDQVKQQLAELQQANQTDQEKALAAAREEARAEAVKESGTALALEVFNGAAGRRNADYDTAPALSLIDLGKFVKDDGSVDRDAIKAAVEQLVPEKQESKTPPSYGGGPRKNGTDRPEPTPGMGRLRAAYSQQPTN